MPFVLYIAERNTSAFQMARLSADVACAGDSITGWNNFGAVRARRPRSPASRDAGLNEELTVGPFGSEADETAQLLAVTKGDHGRDRGNMQPTGKFSVGLHVQRHDLGTALVF